MLPAQRLTGERLGTANEPGSSGNVGVHILGEQGGVGGEW